MSDLQPEKFFSLRKPCANCPFRSDLDFPLRKERRQEIADYLKNGDNFVCHKTVGYDEDDETGEPTSDQSHATACAGARETARRSGYVSQTEQIAQRLGFEFHIVHEDVSVYESLEDWIEHGE